MNLREHDTDKRQRQLDKVSDENHDLRSENKFLREEISRTNDERDHLRDWLLSLSDKLEKSATSAEKKKRGGLGKMMFLAILGIAAWALGSPAGRRKLSEMKDSMSGAPGDVQHQVSETLT